MNNQATNTRVNLSSLFRVGIVAGILAVVAHFGGQWLGAAESPVASETPAAVALAPASDSATTPIETPATGPNEAVDPLAALLAAAEEMTRLRGEPVGGDTSEAAVELQASANELSYTDGSAECIYSAFEALGLDTCRRNTARFARTYIEAYGEEAYRNRLNPNWHPGSIVQSPAPVHTTMAPATNDGGYLDSSPRGGNYVPEHWPAELRALLQYPSGLRSQRWVQENLP